MCLCFKVVATTGRNMKLFLLLNTIINPYYHSCGFMTDIYLTISPIISSWAEGCIRFHYANGSQPDSVSIVRVLTQLNALSEHLARLSAQEDCTDCITPSY